ncbi:restriction endonuclease subunit S [Leucobacter sp. HY1910]
MTSQTLTVDDVCIRVTSGGTPSRRISEYFDGTIPWLKTQELRDGWVYETEEHITNAAIEKSSAKLLPTNTVMMAMYGGTVGKLAILGTEMTCNQAACAMIVDPSKADYRYLYYALLNDRSRIVHRANGAAQQNLSARTIKALEYNFPAVEEQRAIAATLGALDDKIASNRRAIKSISDLIDAMSEQLGATLPGVPVGELAESFKLSVNPSKLGDSVVDHFSLPAFDSGAQPERVPASTIMSNKLRVPELAILISRLNPRFNRTWWASEKSGTPALASTEFLVLRAESELDLAAVWLAVRAPFFRSELPRRVTGTSGSHQRVRPDDVLGIEVPDFSIAEKNVKKLALALLQRAELLREETNRLVVLRDSLLPELLSGRIRVPVESGAR